MFDKIWAKEYPADDDHSSPRVIFYQRRLLLFRRFIDRYDIEGDLDVDEFVYRQYTLIKRRLEAERQKRKKQTKVFRNLDVKAAARELLS
jgi:hypothetical protein